MRNKISTYVWAACFALLVAPAPGFATDFTKWKCDARQTKLSVLHILERQAKLHGVAIAVVEFFDVEQLPTSSSAELHCQATITISTGEEGHIHYRAFLGKSGQPLIEVKPIQERM